MSALLSSAKAKEVSCYRTSIHYSFTYSNAYWTAQTNAALLSSLKPAVQKSVSVEAVVPKKSDAVLRKAPTSTSAFAATGRAAKTTKSAGWGY